ncbi:DUF87 domain-containing protein [Candidatus Parcubacteria bacterium]|nr:MAG: DUF87 domain-containing protein [Candidatus Parcubacteria bacterium]
MPNNFASTLDLVGVEDVRDDTILLKDGGLRKVVMAGGVNFALKSEAEQNVITQTYQNFLNSLDFPTQTIIHSRKVNIDKYLESLAGYSRRASSPILQNQSQEYQEFIRSFVQKNPIMEKSFLVVIPFVPIGLPNKETFTNFLPFLKTKGAAEAAKNAEERELSFRQNLQQLDQRVGQVVGGLAAAGIDAVPLKTEELIELLYNFYNPETVEKEKLNLPGEVSPTSFKDIAKIIAPAGVEVSSNQLKIGNKFAKVFFFFSYPRYLATGWLEPLINLPCLFDIAIFSNPVDTGTALKNLRKKAAQIESQIGEQQEKGLVRDPMLETALKDVESLRDSLQQAEEKLFDVGVYFMMYADSQEELARLESQVISLTEAKLIYVKPALFEQLEGFSSILPFAQDKVGVYSPMNSSPLSSFFPFVSEDLTSNQGILYGINLHNSSLVVFDRFSLENANQVVFAKSGSGKSYATKLEIIRSLMMDIENVIVIDPENEYRKLSETFGGSLFNISLSSKEHINPFDIPIIPEGESPSDVLRSHIVNLSSLVKLMLGKVTPEEDALLDRAITETYASREIVVGEDFSKAQAPLLEDLETVLRNLEGGRAIADRLYKFTKGSFAGFVNQPTNIDITNRLIVFSIRDLEDELRPIAMFVILNFIWNLIRAQLKRRLLIIDEAWWMMKNEDSATFLFGLVKRARKYYLGVSTITQDVEDFLRSPYGRPIITNSSLQLLLKQAPATIDIVAKAFDLTEAEKSFLLSAEVGNGLFFAGKKHVAIRIVPSYFEDQTITTNPQQLLEEKK